eukprot:TRINITY_DN634_c0_g1_i1.p8 TRINITY_DN634_c0_g1~~TRINITY_DN634_c0_g1_i1.p8  ORF type:complete len:423 (-),score=120.42 TRINITY_DN634_c0_g1_i1:17387-18655(-)
MYNFCDEEKDTMRYKNRYMIWTQQSRSVEQKIIRNTKMTDSKASGAKNAATITLSEFMRIKNSINVPTAEDADTKKLQRKTMHEIAQTKVKNWPNTIDTLRKKKEDDKLKKLRDEEIKRREIDAKEAAFQHQQRRAAIERANEVLYQQQDQVKAFNSKMMLADVLQERDAQLQINQRKKEILKGIEQEYVEVEKAQMNNYDEKEKTKAELDKQKKAQNAHIIKDQWKEAQIKKQKLAQESKVEGELIKKQVAEELEKDYLKEMERKQKALEAQQEFLAANERLQKVKEEAKQKDLELERKTLEYAQEKERMANLRKQKEEERFKNKQAVRQKMIDKQVELLKNIQNAEEKRLQKQVAEAEEKAQKEFEEKERRFKEAQEAIERTRLAQLEKKKVETEQKRKENEQYTAMWKTRMTDLVLLYH